MKWYSFPEIVTDATSKFKKIKASDYHIQGKYKIIDQGKEPVAGYTDDINLVNRQLLPILIFGDHTRVLKYVDDPIALGADGAKALWVNPELANTRYLYYYLRSIQIKEAGYSRHFKFLKEIEIPIPFKDGAPNFDDQTRIAHLLGKVEGLIAQRKLHLQQLEDLLKSMFLEMFGDIRAKKSNHPWIALRPYLTANSGKSCKNVVSDKETGIPIFGGNGINGWAIKALYEKPVIVVGRVGQQCGVTHLSNGPCWVTDNAIVLGISDDSQLNIVYLAKALHYAPIRERVKQLDLPFINQPMLLDYPLPLPPISLQNRFAVIVDKIESVKASYQRSLAELEILYGALSQQAFKGELSLSRIPMPAQHITAVSIEDQAAVSMPAVQEEPAISLPETDLLAPALADREQLKPLLHYWLGAYLAQLGDTVLSIERFMAAAQIRLSEQHPDDEFDLGTDTYEHVKQWLFEALGNGRLQQSRNITGQDKNGKPIFGNLIEITSGAQP